MHAVAFHTQSPSVDALEQFATTKPVQLTVYSWQAVPATFAVQSAL
jgi:hypothetical protein